jgi:hypothetical protein
MMLWSCGAVDREELAHKPYALERKRAVARLVLGEDEDAAGGLEVDQSFVNTTLSSASCVRSRDTAISQHERDEFRQRIFGYRIGTQIEL